MRFKGLFIILSVIFLVSCNKNIDYSDHKNRNYEIYYETFGIDDLNDFYKLDGDTYLIYMYGSTCPPCENIKGVVFDYLDKKLSMNVKDVANFYMYEREKDPNYYSNSNWSSYYFKDMPEGASRNTLITQMIGAKSLSDTYFFGTPSIYIIKNHTLDNLILGGNACGAYFYKLL